jgi:homoserine kinase
VTPIHVQETSKPGIEITKIIGQDLPLEATKNVAGVAGLALLADYGRDKGFQIQIEKGIKPGSGIGSSSASAAGCLWLELTIFWVTLIPESN